MYLDLIDGHRRWDGIRHDWEKRDKETRARGARHGVRLAKARNPFEVLDRWNGWVDECEAAGQNVDYVPLVAAFGALAGSNLALARTLIETIVDSGMSIGRFTDDCHFFRS